MTIREPQANVFDKISQLDAQAMVLTMARFAVREHNRKGLTLLPSDAKNRAIVALSDLLPQSGNRQP